MKGIHQLLHQLATRGGSDLHLAEGARPKLRLHGDLIDMEFPVLTQRVVQEYLQALVSPKRYEDFLESGDLDFAWEWEGVARFRCNYFVSHTGLGGVFRLVPATVVPFARLGLPNTLIRFTQHQSGLILLTGPTGSGKSTTLAAMIDHVNSTRPAHIITIEDPIEFVHTRKKAYLSQREIGAHATSFRTALTDALREDPDVLMVGELRDQAATALALTAAEMGFLVMATLHTGSAGKTVNRIVDMFPTARRAVIRQQLAGTLIGVISQALFKRADGSGQAAAAEILVATNQLRTMIRDGATHQIPSAFQQGISVGCQTMDQSILYLLQKRVISKQEALYKISDRALIP